MARKSNAQLRTVNLVATELRKGNRAQPIPTGKQRGSRTTREFGARAWELRMAD